MVTFLDHGLLYSVEMLCKLLITVCFLVYFSPQCHSYFVCYLLYCACITVVNVVFWHVGQPEG